MQNIDNEALRQRVEDRVKREKRTTRVAIFVVSFLLFVTFMVISIVMFNMAAPSPELIGSQNSPALGPMILLGIGWFLTIIFQGISLLMDLGAMDRSIRDRALTGEMARQLYEQATGDYEKPKRHLEDDMDYTVSDDGELVPTEEETQNNIARKL